MASSSVCWGIEIGAAAIKAVKLELSGESSARLLEFVNIPHPKPLSTPDVNPNDVLRVSIGALASQYDLSKAQIAVSVPGHSAFARFAKLPPVEPKKVPDIVKFEAMQQIPFPLDQVEWDYQTFVTPDSPDVEVGIFAITRERVMERLAMLQDVGITPNYVVLSPIAVYNALAYDLGFDNNAPGTIIVDVGTTSTDLVIATPGRMWIRTFPIGGHQFTEALVQQFQLSYPKAEKLKREAEDSKHARQVFQAMRPVFTNLAQDIQRSIGYYQSLNKDANLTRLIGVGSTFLLPGLRKYLKQQLSMDVYRVEEFKKLKAEGEFDGKFQADSLNYATAYGLALQGLGLNAVGGNLMPVSVLRRSMWKEKVPYFGIAAGVAVAAGVAMFVFPMRDDMAVKQSSPPQVLTEVANKHRQLKSEADQAGVLTGGEPDTKAANLIGILDHRAVYQSIVRDVQLLYNAADKRAVTWAKDQAVAPVPGAAFELASLTTRYLAPTSQEASTPGAPVNPDAPADPLKIAEFPRIECSILMRTHQPEPRKFMQDVTDAWLKANRHRADVAYEIVTADRPFAIAEGNKQPESADTPAASSGGAFRPNTGASFDRPISSRRRAPGTNGDAPVIESAPGGAVGIRSSKIAGAIVVGGAPEAASSATDQAEAKRKADALAEIDKLADFLTIQPKSGMEGLTGTVRFNWYVVFKPPAPADAASPAGEAPKAGGGK
jgi:type IV pilus assembly protein PilM